MTASCDESLAGATCPRCVQKGTLMCTRCEAVTYCSRECQQADWMTHKVLCKTFQHFQSRPTPDHRRIVVCLPGEPKPRFLWAPIKDHDDFQDVDYTSFCSPATIFKNAFVFTNRWNSEKLEHTIQWYYDDDFNTRYSEPNMAAYEASGRANTFEWRGPLYAICGTLYHGKLDMAQVSEMDMKTYGHLTAFLSDYWNNDPRQELRKGPKVDCVKATCRGERRVSGASMYEAVQVPASYPIFEVDTGLSAISERLGLSLLCMKYPSNKHWTETNDHYNQVTTMHYRIDPSREEFGWSPPMWDLGVGSVLIAQRERQPLAIETVDAFGDFCQFHFAAYVEWTLEKTGEGGLPLNKTNKYRQAALEELTPEKWTAYLARWRARKANPESEPRPEKFYQLADDEANRMLAENSDLTGLSEHEQNLLSYRLLLQPSVKKDSAQGLKSG